MSWSALIQWGDRLVRVSGIDVTIEERIDLASKEGGYAPQRLQIAAILPYDAAAYMYRDGWRPNQAGVVIEDEDGQTIRGYPVQDIQPGRDGEVTIFVVGNAKVHSSSQIPSTASELIVSRINVERTQELRGSVADRTREIIAATTLIAELRGMWGTWGNRYGVIGDRAESGALAKAKARLEHAITRASFEDFDALVEGRTYPLIFGKPGRCNAGIRAILASMVDDVEERVMIAGHVAQLGTCQFFGPSNSDPDALYDSEITQATFADQAGKIYTGVDVDTLSQYAHMPDSADKQWFASYHDSQTAHGLPSDIGGALAVLMGHTVGALVDFPAFADMSARLPLWRVDGVVDQVTSAWDLLSMSLLPIMPVTLVDGARGVRPVYTGTLRDWKEATARLVEGPLFAGLGAPSVSSAGGVVNDVTVAYGYDVRDRQYRRNVHLTGLDVDYLGDSRSEYGYRPHRVETAWCYDDATAGDIARHIAHRLHRQLVTLEYLATPEVHGLGGDSELQIGDVVRLTDDRYSITDRLGMVTLVSRSPARLVIGVTLLEARVPDYVVPPVVVSTIYILAAGDNGSSQSAARTSTDAGATWAAVSGLPSEGVLNGTAYDEDGGQFLAAGQAGAACVISQDGSTVTDVTIGGTVNREGVGYRPSSESGGALWVVVGQSGRLDYSTDATTWTTVSSFGSTALYAALYHDGYWYVGGNSGKVWYSSSGTGSYTSADPAGTQRVSDMAWSGTHIVASRRSGKIAYATPANARAGSWSAATSGVSVHLFAVASDEAGAVVIVGASGTILHSTDDGATWASRTSGVATALNGVAWNGSTWLIVGDGGVVLTSTDGITWTAQTSGTGNDLMWVETSAGYP
jgi:hypothetical protein